MGRARRPTATVVVFSVTLVVSIAALASTDLMHKFERNLPSLRSGQWWRVATPVLVQPSGWGQLAFNILGIAIVGAALQRRVGWTSWSLIYAAGGAGSIAVYSAWHPADTGGGSSAAVAALIGAFLIGVNLNREFGRLEWFAEVYSVFFAVYLSTLDIAGVAASIVAGNAAIILMFVARHAANARTLARGSLAVGLVSGVAMILTRDDHGVGLAIGATVAAVLLTRRWLLSQPTRRQWWVTAIAVPTVAAAAVCTWVAWVQLLGIPLVVRQPGNATSDVNWVSVAVAAASACLAASFALRLLTRSTAHGRAIWISLCLGIALVSVIGPLSLAVGTDAMVGLLSLHLICAAAIGGLLAPSPTAQKGDRTPTPHHADTRRSMVTG